MHQRNTLTRSFTLIELLVVISIIALLIALLLPSLAKARSVAQAAACMSNARQFNIAATAYLFDNNGEFCPGADTVGSEGPAWHLSTWYFVRLLPYYNDWDILVDPARNNDREEAIRRTGMSDLPGSFTHDNNYSVVGHSYMFWDARLIAAGQGLKTRIDDIVVPSKTMFSNCVHQGRGGDFLPGMFGREDIFDAIGGGIHNNSEQFTFADGHGDFYSTEPIRQWYLTTSTYAFTYPPGVTASEAQWWAMPYYPDVYPWSLYTAIWK